MPQHLFLTKPVQVESIKKLLRDDDVAEDEIRAALNSKFAAGDFDKAVELLALQRFSADGKIVPCSSKVEMLGAENRGAVTCYLDALLFAMFAKLTAFECMLKDDPEKDEHKRNLAFLLRLWVNMLRTGKLIHTDMVIPLLVPLCFFASLMRLDPNHPRIARCMWMEGCRAARAAGHL